VMGAFVGVAMLARRRKNAMMNGNSMKTGMGKVNRQARGTIRLVHDNAKRLTSAVKTGTESFTRKLARRG
jgi:cell division protein FtsI/penicillin-binding protein 2